MIWEFLQVRVPAWLALLLCSLFALVIGTNSLSHRYEIKHALKNQGEKFVTTVKHSKIVAELEAERQTNDFLQNRIKQNKSLSESFSVSIDDFERQKQSDISSLTENYEDYINELLSKETACVVTPDLLNRLRSVTSAGNS